ncbi:arylacetamide deacetylase-like 4 [Perognathus longimembris pacificus]|uniref:arylacetamide deacetylase-like 4 n=1 Tax=Perognathus longimembris pacificus TaxID=214514 RepID=UPI0020198E30|nr:arylacetamide deacetylase-like 4 [Perognathus longimembris pacificus]
MYKVPVSVGKRFCKDFLQVIGVPQPILKEEDAMIALLVTLLIVWYTLVLGVSLWIVIQHWLIIDVPPAIGHPVNFRIVHCLSHLTFRWGYILEKLKICSMARFCQLLQNLLAIGKDSDVVVTNLRFGTIPVRLFQPKAMSPGPRRGIVYYHGGGTVVGSLDIYHNVCSFLVKKTDSVLLAVGYRKLPDCHYPTCVQDCLNATIHFLKTLKIYGVDPSRVVVSGDSSGGYIVALVTQALVGRTDLPKLRAQILIYPVVQFINLQLPSFQQNKNVQHFLTRAISWYFQYFRIDPCWEDALLTGASIPANIWEKYKKWLSSDNLPERFRHKDYKPEFLAPFNEAAYLETRHLFEADYVPLLADDQVIAQVPEAFLVTSEWDIFRDDGLLYKKRLEDQGVPVSWYHAEDSFHGCIILFDSKLFSFPCSEKVMTAIAKYLTDI